MLSDADRSAPAKDRLKLAPFIGIGCPGLIDEDGIDRARRPEPARQLGEQPLQPAATALARHLPKIDGHDTVVVMHNDAVVQGLSEVPFMQDVEHWGVLTIGTGLGNARFTNKKADD